MIPRIFPGNFSAHCSIETKGTSKRWEVRDISYKKNIVAYDEHHGAGDADDNNNDKHDENDTDDDDDDDDDGDEDVDEDDDDWSQYPFICYQEPGADAKLPNGSNLALKYKLL